MYEENGNVRELRQNETLGDLCTYNYTGDAGQLCGGEKMYTVQLAAQGIICIQKLSIYYYVSRKAMKD